MIAQTLGTASLSRYSRNDSLPPRSGVATTAGFQEAASCTHRLRTLCLNAIKYYPAGFCAGNAPSCGGAL